MHKVVAVTATGALAEGEATFSVAKMWQKNIYFWLAGRRKIAKNCLQTSCFFAFCLVRTLQACLSLLNSRDLRPTQLKLLLMSNPNKWCNNSRRSAHHNGLVGCGLRIGVHQVQREAKGGKGRQGTDYPTSWNHWEHLALALFGRCCFNDRLFRLKPSRISRWWEGLARGRQICDKEQYGYTTKTLEAKGLGVLFNFSDPESRFLCIWLGLELWCSLYSSFQLCNWKWLKYVERCWNPITGSRHVTKDIFERMLRHSRFGTCAWPSCLADAGLAPSWGWRNQRMPDVSAGQSRKHHVLSSCLSYEGCLRTVIQRKLALRWPGILCYAVVAILAANHDKFGQGSYGQTGIRQEFQSFTKKPVPPFLCDLAPFETCRMLQQKATQTWNVSSIDASSSPTSHCWRSKNLRRAAEARRVRAPQAWNL